MIHEVSLPPSKLRIIPLLLPVRRLQVSIRKQPRADIVTQYASQKKAYASKTAAASSGIDVKVDTARCYWPGQPVETLIKIPKHVLETCSELRFELKGLVNTHVLRSTGQSTNIQIWSETLFQRVVSIDVGDDGQPSKAFNGHPSTLVNQMPPSADSDGSMEWACTFGLPERCHIIADGSRDGPRKLINLPPTFRDDSPGLVPGPTGASTYVAYFVKVTGVVKGKIRSNARAWVPILVLPFAESRPALSMQLPSFSSPSFQLAIPDGWVRSVTESKLKKLVLLDNGAIEVEVALPRPVNIPLGKRVPFIMRIKVHAASRKDVEDGGAVPLPELPLTGAGEKHPSFSFRRVEHCSASGRMGTTVAVGSTRTRYTRSRTTQIPCDVVWGTGHVPGIAGAAEGDWSALLSLGHTWSEPHLVDDDAECAAPNAKGKGNAKKCWQREACVTGTLLPCIPPSVSLPKLQVSYTLGLTWTLKGLGNGIKTDVVLWHASSGMSANLVEKLSVEQVSRQIAGDKYALLTGQSDLRDEEGEEEHVEEDIDEDEDEVDCLPEYEEEQIDAPVVDDLP